MRHGKKFNHLGRTAAHRKAMLSNMASSLIEHKRINTTVAKAKALQKYIEPLITKSKVDTTHNRRTVFSYLKNKFTTDMLFGELSSKIGTRQGGYTRVIKTGFRLGDGAEMALIELVDFNEIYSTAKVAKTTRRSRRGKSTETADVVDVAVSEANESGIEDAQIVEENTSPKTNDSIDNIENDKES